MRALDIADIAKRHGVKLTADKAALDFCGGRIVSFGDDWLVFHTTIRETTEAEANVIRHHGQILCNTETGYLTVAFHPRRLNDLVLAVRAAESHS